MTVSTLQLKGKWDSKIPLNLWEGTHVCPQVSFLGAVVITYYQKLFVYVDLIYIIFLYF